MSRKKAKLAAKAILARKNWKKSGSIWNQVSEAYHEGKLTRPQKEIKDKIAYEENKKKASQSRKRSHSSKESFSWAGTGAIQTIGKMKNSKTNWTWSEGDMAKIGRDLSRHWGIPKDAICMVISDPTHDGAIQILFDGQPFNISAASLRPVGWVEDED